MSTLYVLEAGSRLEKEHQRLLVTRNDELLLRVPLGRVSRVVLVGSAGATTAALHALLEAGIPLVLISRSGRLLGQLAPPMPGNLLLRRAQYRRDEDGRFCLELARDIVAGKLRNQRTLAGRLARRHPELEARAAAELDACVARAEAADALDALRGIEGYGARVYFRLLRGAFDPAWGFRDRNRRPPRDPVNALLSLGYSLLTQNMMTALEITGLDPYLGYFHSETYNRPALALDLVEEFRAPVVDSLVLWLTRRRILQEDDFRTDEAGGGVGLTDPALRLFLTHYSRKLESALLVRELGRRLTYRKLFEVQARRLARVISGEEDAYRPFRAR
jgi:CRISPR-associated protein Cas1